MSELRLISSHASTGKTSPAGDECFSEPELELNSFINSVTSLIGPGATNFLTELWLDELACMDCTPGRHGPNW